MQYIIDANNLCGKLGLLGEKDFDKDLKEIVAAWLGEKNHQVFLVFDSADLMGDKLKEGNITTIYTPKDTYYNSADDKIVELVEQAGRDAVRNELVVVTDDIEIQKQVEEIEKKLDKGIMIERATDFAKKLEQKFDRQVEEKRNKGDLSEEEMDGINSEFLRIWK